MPVGDRPAWLEGAENAASFLKANAVSDYLVVYASMPAAFIYAVLAPESLLAKADKKRLADAHFSVDATWCIQHVTGGGEPPRIYLEKPLESTFNGLLENGEPIVIRRDFPGLRGYRSPVEVNQRIVHALNLHWLPERKAYCELDDRGDLVDVIVLHEIAGKTGWDDTTVVLVQAKKLSDYMAVSGQSMLRKFDFTRTAPESFRSWDGRIFSDHESDDLVYHGGKIAGQASYINGVQVILSRTTVDAMVNDWIASKERPHEYETFKMLDIRDRSLVEVSCGPDGVRNYFTAADKPFETSPVFFVRKFWRATEPTRTSTT